MRPGTNGGGKRLTDKQRKSIRTLFGVPGSNFTQACDINPAGDVVGMFRDNVGK